MSRFFEAMAQPEGLGDLSIQGWDDLLRDGVAIKALARLSHLIERLGLEPGCPPDAVEVLRGARHQPDFVQTRVLWEARHIRRLLRNVCEPVLLKGAAYAATGLAAGHGRHMADLDILVPRERLDAVETTLCAAGYEAKPLGDYDERYYREWMHELPPHIHPGRGIEIDIHHNILPPVGQFHPRPDLLLDAARTLDNGFRVLAPVDMVLNSAAHLFQSEIRDGQKDVLDLHLLLTELGADPAFWSELATRAAAHGLNRPLYFALTLCEGLLDCPVPANLRAGLDPNGARGVLGWLLLPLARSLLEAFGPGRREPWLARLVLLAHSHLARMPPGLLARHLWRKALVRKG